MKDRGFTLVELVTTVAVAAVLTALAVPSFTSALRGSAMSADSTSLVSALNLARSEAIKRAVQVQVIANNGSWVNGWDVQLTDGSSPLRVMPALASGYTLTANPAVTVVTYDGTGLRVDANASSPVVFTLCDSNQTGETGYTVSVTSTTGHVDVASYQCS